MERSALSKLAQHQVQLAQHTIHQTVDEPGVQAAGEEEEEEEESEMVEGSQSSLSHLRWEE